MTTENQTQETCDCGGALRPATVDAFDFSRYVGFKVTLYQAEVLRCDTCGWTTLDGTTINALMNHMVLDFTKFPRRLNGTEARYLRHSIEATQEELASRMGVVRETVAKWECGDQTISPQHDFILRMLALSGMVSRGIMTPEAAGKILSETFIAVRSDPPKPASTINMAGVDLAKYTHGSAGEKRAAFG